MASIQRQIPLGDNICLFCLRCLSNPVDLRCYHRLCKNCVQSYWEKTQSMKCPVCFKEILCKVSLQNPGNPEMSGSICGNLLLRNKQGEMVSVYLSWLGNFFF